MNDLFDDELRRRLKAYTEEPDPRLWESILSQVSTGRTVPRRRPWMLMIILGLVVTSGLYVLLNSEVKTGPSVQSTDSKESPHLLPADVEQERETTGQMQEKSNATGSGSGRSGRHDKGNQLSIIPNIPIVSDRGFVVRGDDYAAIGELGTVAPSTISVIAVGISADNTVPTDVESIPDLLRKEINSAGPDTTQMHASSIREKKRHPFNVYFTVMPTMAYNRVEPNPHDNLIVESIDRLAAFSTERLGVRAELGVEYPVARRVNVFGGLVYFQRHQTIGYIEKQVSNTETKPGPNGEIIIEPDFSYVHKSFEHEVRNLGIQLGVNYQLRKKKFLHTAGTGIEFHTALNMSRPQEATANPSAYVFYNLYYRMQYPAETKFRAVLQPTLNYSFYINENLNAPFYVKPYGLGLNVGFTYNLKPGGR